MNKVSRSASSLKTLMKKAIDDLEVTPEEYKNIMEHAHENRQIDEEEQTLLSQFQSMISNGTINRVRG